MWMGFVISVIAAVSLQYVDPFGTKKLVLFEVEFAFHFLLGFCSTCTRSPVSATHGERLNWWVCSSCPSSFRPDLVRYLGSP